MIVFVSFLTLLAHVFIVILLWIYFTGERAIGGFIEKQATFLAFLAGLGAVSGSLYFSNVLGFEPCGLCWYQRFFMFPAVLILGIAVWKKYCVKKIVLALLAAGAAVALYHNYGLLFNLSALPCGAAGVSCAKVYFMEFGYITIPVMSLTAFVLMGVLMLFQRTE